MTFENNKYPQPNEGQVLCYCYHKVHQQQPIQSTGIQLLMSGDCDRVSCVYIIK